jgi:type VI secretion system protein VasD
MARTASTFVLLGWLVGCGSAPPPPPAAPPKPCPALSPALAITATTRINATAAGEGRPLQVRIYQLKSDAKLRAAEFDDIWQNDQKTLEGDLVSAEQQTIFPGKTLDIPLAVKPGAAFVAVVGLFREPKGKDWFVSYELAPAATEPPCPAKATPIAVWIDRMQIQDGAGREPETETAPATDTTAGAR